MSDEQQAEAAAKRTRKAARVPGDTGEDSGAGEQQAAVEPTTQAGTDVGSARFSMPDFRHKSSDYARQWFEKNPQMRKRGVLTADGWYVHPECFKTTAER